MCVLKEHPCIHTCMLKYIYIYIYIYLILGGVKDSQDSFLNCKNSQNMLGDSTDHSMQSDVTVTS